LALATLTVCPLGFAKSMGIAGATVAIVAALASILISPALLVVWGAKLGRSSDAAPAEGRWYRFAQAVMRRPGAGGDPHHRGDAGRSAPCTRHGVVAGGQRGHSQG